VPFICCVLGNTFLENNKFVKKKNSAEVRRMVLRRTVRYKNQNEEASL
jgi:hypothetical protein